MAVTQPPDQHVEGILLRELERVDEMPLEELERVDEELRRIAAAIDQLPARFASASRRELGSGSANGPAAEPMRNRAFSRPFDPYGEDQVEAADKKSAAKQLARKLRSGVAAYAPDREAFTFATLSLAIAMLATVIAVL